MHVDEISADHLGNTQVYFENVVDETHAQLLPEDLHNDADVFLDVLEGRTTLTFYEPGDENPTLYVLLPTTDSPSVETATSAEEASTLITGSSEE